jgi:hypothetical protein
MLVTAGGAAVNRVAYLVEGGDVHIGGVPVKSKHMAVSSVGVVRVLVSWGCLARLEVAS